MPDVEKPGPLTVTEATVRGAVPVEFRVIDCTTGVLSVTLPNPSEVALIFKAAVAAFNCNEVVRELFWVFAVSVTDWALLTKAALAVNLAVAAVAGTVIELGTLTALLLLARLTIRPPVGAEPDKVTLHASASDPVIDVLAQDTALMVGGRVVPAPLKATVTVGALLEIVNCPVMAPALLGLNWMVPITDCPGFNVYGRLAPRIENPAPEIEAEEIVIAVVPTAVSVTEFVTAVPTATFPKDMLPGPTLSVPGPTWSWTLNETEAPLAVALSVATWAVVIGFISAVKLAVVAPAATVMVEGTVICEVLLDKAMVRGVEGAELSTIVQGFVPAWGPVKTLSAQERLRSVTPVCDCPAGEREIEYWLAMPPDCAVIVAVCGAVTVLTVALNAAVLAPCFTVTLPGTVTAGLLLFSDTLIFRLVLDVRWIKQASVPEVLSWLLLHEM
jgi:hypothetical protein